MGAVRKSTKKATRKSPVKVSDKGKRATARTPVNKTRPAAKKTRAKATSPAASGRAYHATTPSDPTLARLEREIRGLGQQELRELLLVNTYKMAMLKAQVEALIQILIRKRLASYEEIWQRTNEVFKDSSLR